jgi:hypothetical protein
MAIDGTCGEIVPSMRYLAFRIADVSLIPSMEINWTRRSLSKPRSALEEALRGVEIRVAVD